jgi:hypothetical protein
MLSRHIAKEWNSAQKNNHDSTDLEKANKRKLGLTRNIDNAKLSTHNDDSVRTLYLERPMNTMPGIFM